MMQIKKEDGTDGFGFIYGLVWLTIANYPLTPNSQRCRCYMCVLLLDQSL